MALEGALTAVLRYSNEPDPSWGAESFRDHVPRLRSKGLDAVAASAPTLAKAIADLVNDGRGKSKPC